MSKLQIALKVIDTQMKNYQANKISLGQFKEVIKWLKGGEQIDKQ